MNKKLLLVILLCVLFILSGCVSAQKDSNGKAVETIKAIISYGNGTTETVEVDHFSSGHVSLILYLTDGRTIYTSCANTVIITEPIN